MHMYLISNSHMRRVYLRTEMVCSGLNVHHSVSSYRDMHPASSYANISLYTSYFGFFKVSAWIVLLVSEDFILEAKLNMKINV